MLTDDEIKNIIHKTVFDLGELQEIIQQYIYERKQVQIKLELPRSIFELQFFIQAANHCLDFFIIKYNLEEYLLFHPKN